MLSRCENPAAPNFQWYGARGITVCERWRAFANFLADMGERPSGTTLDRIDGTRGYQPGNCRWATPAEQSQNISTNKLNPTTATELANRARSGEPVAALALEFGVSRTTVCDLRDGRKWANVVGAWRKETT
jgi:hypothetical protein